MDEVFVFIVGLQSRLVGALVYKLEGKAHTHTQVGVGGGIIIFMMMVLLRQEGLGVSFYWCSEKYYE